MLQKFSLLLVLALAACAAHETSPPAAVNVPLPQTTPASPLKSGNVELDLSCETDNDCAIKDVGNCCGYYPMCVNKNSPVDPEGVAAQCRAKGRIDVCGFQNIESCSCVAHKCAANVVMVNATPAQ
jgi:hypothetical protein